MTLLTGWGRTAPTGAEVVAVATPEDVVKPVADASERGIVARGLARSYGDSAQNGGGTVLDLTPLSGVLALDLEAGTARVAAGTSLDDLMRWLLPLGWFVPVTPGTRYVTVGGAVASDIHGKNHHVDGSFCAAVTSIVLLLASGEQVVIGPGPGDADPAAFWATAGGMGLTGVVLEATFRLRKVSTTRMLVDTERATDLDDCLARMAASDDDYRYSVAWIDCVARGRSLGRSVLTRGDHAELDDLSVKERRGALAFSPSERLQAPPFVPSGLLNRLTVGAFNEAWYRKAPVQRRGQVQSIAAFFHPLDGVGGWNRLYGPRGFLQHQCLLPFGQEGALREVVERLASSGAASFLAVLKRFGPADPGHLSFPAPGWTLALDLPLRADLGPLLDGIDEVVVAAGGRIYLAKDSRVRPELLGAMYPRLDEWRSVRARLDPDHRFASDQSRRLDL